MCVVILKEFGPPWKKQYFRNDKYMGFIKGGWLNVISEWLLLLYLRLALKSSGKKYQEGMMDVKWWRQEQRGTPKHDLEVVLASPCIQSSFCNEVVIFWEWKKSNMLDYCPTKWGSRSATDFVDCHSAWGLALPFWAQRIWLLHSRLPNLYKMSHMFHINLKLCKEGYSGKCSFQLS